MSADNRSPVQAVQEQHGGVFSEEDGWFWCDNFGDVDAEFRAIREGACLWDVYGLQKWELTGPDAARAAQRAFTNNLSTMSVGQVRYGPVVDDAGAMIDDATVFKLAEDRWWVFTNGTGLADHLAPATADLDYELANNTHEMPLLSVQGPESRALLQGLSDVDLSTLRYFTFVPERVTLAGVPVWLLRTGFSGELGFELIPRRDDAVSLWTALAEAGARPVGYDAVNIARVEAGFLIRDQDYLPGETSPYDVSLDPLIAVDAGLDFVGQDVLRAVAAAPPHRFRSLRIEGDTPPEEGVEVMSDSAPVGTLTSVVESPAYGVLGLAILRTEVADEGRALQVPLPDGSVAAAVVATKSIHDPEKRKVRS
jgi:glycine cleavage system aminomethyltransferase T